MLASSGTGGVFVLAASQQETEQTLHQLLVVEFVAGGIILIIAALGGMWLVKLGLRPLVRIEAAAETIAEENLTERLPGAEANTEVGRLARVLNTMLGRLETSFAERKASEERLGGIAGVLRLPFRLDWPERKIDQILDIYTRTLQRVQ